MRDAGFSLGLGLSFGILDLNFLACLSILNLGSEKLVVGGGSQSRYGDSRPYVLPSAGHNLICRLAA